MMLIMAKYSSKDGIVTPLMIMNKMWRRSGTPAAPVGIRFGRRPPTASSSQLGKLPPPNCSYTAFVSAK